VKEIQGRVIIDFEYDESKEKCRWTIQQKGKDTLDDELLTLLFQHIVGELLSSEK
jgi:hypothetical protein